MPLSAELDRKAVGTISSKLVFLISVLLGSNAKFASETHAECGWALIMRAIK